MVVRSTLVQASRHYSAGVVVEKSKISTKLMLDVINGSADFFRVPGFVDPRTCSLVCQKLFNNFSAEEYKNAKGVKKN